MNRLNHNTIVPTTIYNKQAGNSHLQLFLSFTSSRTRVQESQHRTELGTCGDTSMKSGDSKSLREVALTSRIIAKENSLIDSFFQQHLEQNSEPQSLHTHVRVEKHSFIYPSIQQDCCRRTDSDAAGQRAKIRPGTPSIWTKYRRAPTSATQAACSHRTSATPTPTEPPA